MRLTEDEARRRLGAARVLRLATVDADGAPHQVPATFAFYGGGRLAIAVDHKPKRTRDLRRLRNIEAEPRVCALADEYSDDDWTRLWWVRADGTARVLAAGAERGADGQEAAERAEAVDRLVAKYPQYAAHRPDGPVIVIDVARVTGWAYTDPAG
ncbi:TIGR03668 family PPOX class F420-dependent oxidoreductase [Streptomyces montanisoli]|uniref:TIGR03668 family PPOX class F420-dependent oxidoreductase n=1 Tax=Streptomyces montanisoli TaxID=2798581 RepID=A0A940MKP7_9ACTN|nr:TIGR03668 family PPOX class F420-dependent oxidoreductase [Streptomyces montanisoli]MBP0461936.1 TIGR03668 family PPOX class F420-dependent oxidoreductase [Streptomyces montanisoli]